MRLQRFDIHILESLHEDELALLYMLYNKLFDREHVDLRSVIVSPVIAKLRDYNDELTADGIKVRDSIIKKVEEYFK